jgi:hypothetical protein
MKIFLQHKSTMLYLASGDKWTKTSAEAVDFSNYDKAIDFAIKNQLSDLQVVLKFADQPYNICLPFQKSLPPASLQI